MAVGLNISDSYWLLSIYVCITIRLCALKKITHVVYKMPPHGGAFVYQVVT